MCHSQRALQRGIHPSSKLKIQPHHHHHHHHLCSPSKQCIYCDIWKLANLVSTHIPLSTRYNQNQSFSHDFTALEQQIQASFTIERSRLSSIISISTVTGAAESEGLHVAYSRCLHAVERLLALEAVLEEMLVKTPSAAKARYEGYKGYETRRSPVEVMSVL